MQAVVFMMPVPCVRIEFAMCRMLIVLRNLLSDDFSMKICERHLGGSEEQQPSLVVQVVQVVADEHVDATHDLQHVEPLTTVESTRNQHRRTCSSVWDGRCTSIMSRWYLNEARLRICEYVRQLGSETVVRL